MGETQYIQIQKDGMLSGMMKNLECSRAENKR